MSEIICKCKKIDEEFIIEAIKNGAHTVEEVAEITGATTGACKGGRCKKKVQELIAEYK
ncbi:MAG: (2Fe-2S)-binding protein [Clostridium sp.]|nr:(2Fe-2S)-binding protein [Clostridium sp.]